MQRSCCPINCSDGGWASSVSSVQYADCHLGCVGTVGQVAVLPVGASGPHERDIATFPLATVGAELPPQSGSGYGCVSDCAMTVIEWKLGDAAHKFLEDTLTELRPMS